MIGFGPVSRPPSRRAAVMRAGANGLVGGGSTSESHRLPDVWPHRKRLLSRPFPLAGSSSKLAKSSDNIQNDTGDPFHDFPGWVRPAFSKGTCLTGFTLDNVFYR